MIFQVINFFAFLPQFIESRLVQYERKKFFSLKKSTLKRTPTIWIDVSVISKSDARTGIQRVVRSICAALNSQATLENAEVKFIAATKKNNYYEVKWGKNGIENVFLTGNGLMPNPVEGDIFLGLDLSAHILPTKYSTLFKWKLKGVAFYFVVYDLIPYRYPQWFSSRLAKAFRRWLRVISVLGDGFLCISTATKKDLSFYFSDDLMISEEINAYTFPLAGDIENSSPSSGFPNDSQKIVDALGLCEKSYLCVSTIEPRKGHSQLLSAFDLIWKNNKDLILILVGKPGWKTDDIMKKILEHPEYNKLLFWFSDASDDFVTYLYSKVDAVVVPSFAEGFGLPIVEAINHNKPVIARDIPVFREFNHPLISFFSVENEKQLAQTILETSFAIELRFQNDSMPTWSNCCNELITIMEKDHGFVLFNK